MFNHPMLLPIILGIIALAIFYLIVTGQKSAPGEEPANETGGRRWQVQCPNCRRWKKMPPVRRQTLLNEQEALQKRLTPGPQPRFLHEYKCQFCGHMWQEQYSE